MFANWQTRTVVNLTENKEKRVFLMFANWQTYFQTMANIWKNNAKAGC
jgi:hypothetical protein